MHFRKLWFPPIQYPTGSWTINKTSFNRLNDYICYVLSSYKLRHKWSEIYCQKSNVICLCLCTGITSYTMAGTHCKCMYVCVWWCVFSAVVMPYIVSCLGNQAIVKLLLAEIMAGKMCIAHVTYDLQVFDLLGQMLWPKKMSIKTSAMWLEKLFHFRTLAGNELNWNILIMTLFMNYTS